MQRGSIVFQLIVDGNLNSVSPIGVNCRAWILPIDSKHLPREAIRSQSGVCDCELVGNDLARAGPVVVEICVNGEPTAPASARSRTIRA